MDAELLWSRVSEFAGRCCSAGTPIVTISEGTRNFITDVRAGSIGRRSDDGTTNSSRVTRGQVAKLWSELQGGPRADILYLTRALVAAAVPDIVEVVDGEIRLRSRAGRTYMLTWNPDRWHWSTLDEDLDRVLHRRPREIRWSTGNTQRIVPGDRVFLLKQGDPPRGIMGSGVVIEGVVEDDHYDPTRAEQGETALYAKVRFDRLVAPEAVMAVDRIVDGPLADVHWAMPASGFELPAPAAEQLEELWTDHVPMRVPETGPDDLVPGLQYVEGTARTVTVNRYERDPRVRQACIARWGTSCTICGFSFGKVYGSLGEGYIHVHHLQPLASSNGPREVDPVEDLRPVCPNCHAMLHQNEPPLTIDQLRRHLRPSD